MNSILNKEPVIRAEKSLKQFNPELKVIVLQQTARTANDAATALGCKVGAIVKSLLFKAGDSFVLCLVSGDKRCSLNKLKKILEENDVSMANPDDVKKITGYTIGGVSPIGDTPPIVYPVIFLTSSGLAIETSFSSKIFFNLFNEHLLSPETKHKTKLSPALKSKLLTIAPTLQPRAVAASFAVLAVCCKTITFSSGLNCFRDFSALITGSLFSIEFTSLINLIF